MMKSFSFALFFIFSFNTFAQGSNVKIDELIENDNYALSIWKTRGLNPSPAPVIKQLESVTIAFLKSLKQINEAPKIDKVEERKKIQLLVDQLPWSNFDTEEKEFLADVIAPAIESMGYNPWSII